MARRTLAEQLHKRGYLQIELTHGETSRYESDANYRYAIGERAAIMLAEVGWQGNEVRIVGTKPGIGSFYLYTFRYDKP